VDTEELLRRLRECEGRKSPYMQKEPPERLPVPESAPSQYIQKLPPTWRRPGSESAPSQYIQKLPPPERLFVPDSDPFEPGPDPYAGEDLYDLPPDVARRVQRQGEGSYAQPKEPPAPSGYGSKRKYLPPVPKRERGYRTTDFRDWDRDGIDDRDERSAIERMIEAEKFRNKYGDYRRGYGY
jgi:hypothetical protein